MVHFGDHYLNILIVKEKAKLGDIFLFHFLKIAIVWIATEARKHRIFFPLLPVSLWQPCIQTLAVVNEAIRNKF